MFFLCSHSFGAAQGVPDLTTKGFLATFGSRPPERFAFMTEDNAEKLGISKAQMESYNRELDQLNEMMSEVSHELQVMKRPTIDDAASLWSGLKGAVSTATLEAIKKMTKSK